MLLENNAASPEPLNSRPFGLQPFSRLAVLLLGHGARSTPSSRLASRKRAAILRHQVFRGPPEVPQSNFPLPRTGFRAILCAFVTIMTLPSPVVARFRGSGLPIISRALVLGCALLAAGCGGGGKSDPEGGEAPGEAVREPVAVQKFEPIRINVGGPDLPDRGDGRSWVQDESYAQGGERFKFEDPKDTLGLVAAGPEKLYQMVRHKNHRFVIPEVPDGVYKVRFHFIDGLPGRPRRMRFQINGRTVIDAYSPNAVSGAANAVAIEDCVVRIEGGEGMTIDANETDGDDVFCAGIEILPGGRDLTAEPALRLDPAPENRPPVPEDLNWLRALCPDGAALGPHRRDLGFPHGNPKRRAPEGRDRSGPRILAGQFAVGLDRWNRCQGPVAPFGSCRQADGGGPRGGSRSRGPLA